MAIGAQMAQTEPAAVVTTGMRTTMPGGIDLTGAPVRRGHGVGWYRGRCGVSLTQGTMRLLGQPLEGFGRIGALTLRGAGYERGRCDRTLHAWLGLDAVDHEKEPKECTQDELSDDMMRYHGVAPSHLC
jgi:hypothetical protein